MKKLSKIIAILLSLLLCAASFAACNGQTADDGSNAEVTILNDNIVYYDELVEGKFELNVSVTGTENTKLIYLLDQEADYVSVDDGGTVSVSSSIPDNYAFTITAVLDINRSKNHAMNFVLQYTRGIITGERQVGQVVVTINGDPATARGISWFSSYDVEESDVWLSTSSDLSGATKYSGTLNVFEKAAEAGAKEKTAFYNHQCVLTGLTPATTYYYRVGSETMGVYSSVGKFKTAATSGAVTFLLTTDVHIGANETSAPSRWFYHAALSDAMSRAELDFALNTGDMVTMWNGGYSYFESEWARAMNISPLLREITFVPVAGNHDQKHERAAGTYAEHRYSMVNHYSLPASPAEIDDGNANGPNYSFDVSNVHFIIMNIYDSDQPSSEIEQIKTWVERDLAETDKEWIIAFSHREVPDNVKEVLERYGVTIAYSGHEHYYKRTAPMLSGVAQTMNLGGEGDKYLVNQVGTTYVTNTTTGGADEFRSVTPGTNDIDSFGSGVAFGSYGVGAARWGMYTLITIDGDTFTADLYIRPGTTADVPFQLYTTYGFIKNA